ncbi:phage tail protein [Escherichia coli]|uniref:phage tail-collar fiber domain-containing protein n=1 Tax=Escherichia coli TaxID=562 RepID=UPI002FCD447C
MSALLTKAFEKWVAECTASNLPARPDAIIFALMEREPTREDTTVPEEKITYAVNELTYGQLSPNNIVCSAVVPDDCAFSYDWICLIHQASRTLCGVIKTPVRQKHTGESLVRNFTITYQGVAQAAHITVPPQSWQVDITPELKSMLKAPNRLSELQRKGKSTAGIPRQSGLKVLLCLMFRAISTTAPQAVWRYPVHSDTGIYSLRRKSCISARKWPRRISEMGVRSHPRRYAVTQSEESSTSYNPIIAYDMGTLFPWTCGYRHTIRN